MTIKEVWGYMIRNLSLMSIILLTFSASIILAIAQDASLPGAGGMESSTVGVADLAGVAGSANATENDAAEVTAPMGRMQGIWKASFGENEVVMAVNQSGQFLFGLAKYEGELPWNGALAGFMSENNVSISLAAMDDGTLSSTCILATLDGEGMKGFFIRSDDSGKAEQGEFSAILIDPDTSHFTPAVVAAAPSSADQSGTATVGLEKENASKVEVAEPSAIEVSESRFKDVTSLAKGINPNILPRMAPL
jgi:hypothetical protein